MRGVTPPPSHIPKGATPTGAPFIAGSASAVREAFSTAIWPYRQQRRIRLGQQNAFSCIDSRYWRQFGQRGPHLLQLAQQAEGGENTERIQPTSMRPKQGQWELDRHRYWWRKEVHSRRVVKAPAKLSFRVGDRFKTMLAGRCFHCLVRDHRVAQCREPIKCLGRRTNGHITRHCPNRLSRRSRLLRPLHQAPLPSPTGWRRLSVHSQSRTTWRRISRGQGGGPTRCGSGFGTRMPS